MSNNLTAMEVNERQYRQSLHAAEREAYQNKYKTYLDEQHERVRQDCGNHSMFEQCTWWCKNNADRWANDHRDMHGKHHDASEYPGYSSMIFMRDVIMDMFPTKELHLYPPFTDYNNQVGGRIPELLVVGEHTSKSIRLPVMQFQWEDMLVTTRYNFHDWKVSIRLPECLDLEKDLMDIVEADDNLLNPVYFEGFPKAYIFSPLTANDYELTAQFSVMFGNKYRMWTFFWLIKKWYNGRFGPIDQTED